jgi:hypothetical protein
MVFGLWTYGKVTDDNVGKLFRVHPAEAYLTT